MSNIFFDVQGTLVARGRARPHVRRVFLELTEMGHHVYLWSSAGSAYARDAARSLEIGDRISGCYSKMDAPVSVDFAVDDRPEAITGNGYLISPFDGDPDDTELLQVIEQVRKLSA